MPYTAVYSLSLRLLCEQLTQDPVDLKIAGSWMLWYVSVCLPFDVYVVTCAIGILCIYPQRRYIFHFMFRIWN